MQIQIHLIIDPIIDLQHFPFWSSVETKENFYD